MYAAGRVAASYNAVVLAMVVAGAALLLATVARADCFDYCFNDCISKDKSMRDYCNYACDKTCEPGEAASAAGCDGGGDMACQISCAKTTCNRLRPDGKAVEACFGQCYDGCKTNTLPRPLRAGAGAPTVLVPVSETRQPDDYTSEKHHFHEKQDAVQPASKPNPDDARRPESEAKDDALRPASETPDPDGGILHGQTAGLDRNFHEKQGAVQPASEPDKDEIVNHPGQASDPYRTFHEKQDSVLPSSEPDKNDSLRPAAAAAACGSVLPESEIHAAPPAHA